MIDCTEPYLPQLAARAEREGQKSIAKEATR